MPIETYLRTGQAPYPKDNQSLREGLVAEVRRRTEGVAPRSYPAVDLVELTRRKVDPMVRGLFPKVEQPVVLEALRNSTVMICADTIEGLILNESWPHTAWMLANMYLHSLGLEKLSPEATTAVGMSAHLRCFITPAYFSEEDPLADFIVHEAAHVFHNCKRETLGLKATRNREWLLPIAFAQRERFALACEAYSRLVELESTLTARQKLVETIDEDSVFFELLDLLRAATRKRNGWKEILRHCS